jgi:hypothetical protein
VGRLRRSTERLFDENGRQVAQKESVMIATSPRFLVPAARRITTTVAALGLAAAVAVPASAATFDFSGALQAAGGNGVPWVLGSFMWATIETGGGTGTSQSGFNYFATHDITQLTFTFGDLELSSFLSPGPGSPGFERYTDTDGSSVPFTIRLGGTPIATGTSIYLYDEVSHSNDITAVGTGQVILTAPGADPAFYNEVLALTGGSGQLDLTLTGFFPVNNQGLFATTGSFTAVPEPGEYAAVGAAGLLGLALWRRKSKNRMA